MPDGTTLIKTSLECARDRRRIRYFEHDNPGGMTEAGQRAWELEHFGLQLMLEAAQLRLDEEIQLHTLLAAEALPHD